MLQSKYMRHCYLRFEKQLLLWRAMHNSPAQSDRLQRCALPAAAGRGR